MRKWTVRVDDEVGDCFAEFCATNGVSISAVLQTVIDAACARHRSHDGVPVIEWPSEELAAPYWIALIERAREVDARRRQRPRS